MYTGHWCEAQGFFFTVVMVAQQLALLTISLDRNYAIMNSLRYLNVFTQRLCSILIACSWLLSVLVSIPPLLNSDMGNYVFHENQFYCGLDWTTNANYLISFSVLTFGIPLVIQSFCYIKIFFAAVGHSKRSSKVQPFPGRRTTSEIKSDSSNDYSVRRKSVECKAVKTILVIALAYSICWVPYFVDSFLTLKGKDINSNFSAASICFVFSSSIFNPMIYAYMNRVTRHEIGIFVCGISALNDSGDAASTSSAYSTTWALSRIRSKGHGPMLNEMGTIMEETEVDESVFCAPRSVNNLNIACCESSTTLQSQGTRSIRHAETIIVKADNCFQIDEQVNCQSTHVHARTIPTIILPPASDSNVKPSTKCSRKTLKDTAWNIVKSDKFNDERRKCTKSVKSSFTKGRQGSNADCGSFLYFENKSNMAATKSKKKREVRTPHRYSVDHVQSISVGNYPSLMKFRLSLNEANLNNINKVTVKSDFEFVNKAYEHDEGEQVPPADQNTQVSVKFDSPIITTESWPDDIPLRRSPTKIHKHSPQGQLKTILSSSSECSGLTKASKSQCAKLKQRNTFLRLHSAPASLSITHSLNSNNPPPLCRQSSIPPTACNKPDDEQHIAVKSNTVNTLQLC